MNRELLAGAGYGGPELAGARPNDLVIAVRGEGITAEAVASELDRRLAGAAPACAPGQALPVSLAAALEALPGANLALISVPGEHAAREAHRALARGLHVFLFSDNVSIEDEIALKTEALARGLLLMGPDCGTAILNGIGLAFANRVRPGPIGIVGASGTGIQEIACAVHRLGGGISQAIGVGGRDLSDKVGGAMSLPAIRALAADPATAVLVVVSKPPSPPVAEAVVAALAATGKPAVVQFVGAPERDPEAGGRIVFADTLAGAAEAACRLAGIEVPPAAGAGPEEALADRLAAELGPGRTLRGLYCGGTLAQEAVALLAWEGLVIRSNLAKGGTLRVRGLEPVPGHVVLDLGDDVFTRGRPHPMIDPELRSERLALELKDREAGLLLFDLVLGSGSHSDPAGVLAQAVRRARQKLRRRSQNLVAIASITGTDLDEQDLAGQRRTLEKAGIVVMPDNRAAVELAAAVLGRIAP